MSRKNIAQDRYLDAAAALFMDEYTDILELSIDRELKEAEGIVFPEELDTRCRQTLRSHSRTARRAPRRRQMLRGLCTVAAVLVMLLSVFGVLFTQVEAIRVPVKNFLIEKNVRFWEFSRKTDATIPEVFNEADPLGNILPGDFVMTDHFGSWNDRFLWASYTNNDACLVELYVNHLDSSIQLDTEGAQVTEFSYYEHDAVMAIEGDTVRLLWLDLDNEAYFTLITRNVDSEQVLDFAGDIIMMTK